LREREQRCCGSGGLGKNDQQHCKDRCFDFIMFSPNMALLTQTTAKLGKNFILTFVIDKNAKSLK
jgi:hypothetical protein